MVRVALSKVTVREQWEHPTTATTVSLVVVANPYKSQLVPSVPNDSYFKTNASNGRLLYKVIAAKPGTRSRWELCQSRSATKCYQVLVSIRVRIRFQHFQTNASNGRQLLKEIDAEYLLANQIFLVPKECRLATCPKLSPIRYNTWKQMLQIEDKCSNWSMPCHKAALACWNQNQVAYLPLRDKCF